MACTVYITNPRTGVKYAYRSESYRDPTTKQPKSRRTYLGRVDPETNLIVPKGEKGTKNRSKLGKAQPEGSMPPDVSQLIGKLRAEVEQLKAENDKTKEQLKAQQEKSDTLVRQLKSAIDAYTRRK